MENDVLRHHEAAVIGGGTNPTRPRRKRSSTETGAGCATSTALRWLRREQAVRGCIATMIRHGRNNPKMKRNNIVHVVSAAVMLAFTAVSAGQVHAACGKSKRMQHYNADCLEASYKNRGWPRSSSASAKNLCPELGKVVVKVDIRGWQDRTWHLSTDQKRSFSSDVHIRGVFCCKDLSDLCNTSEIVNSDSCFDQFQDSPASATCETSAESIGVSGTSCTIWAVCEGMDQPLDDHGISLSQKLSVHWNDVPDLHNCNGDLTIGSC